jgi:NADH dehydrogenase/NADH:ubiquinone oxidoreductase subunit G
VSTHLLTQPPGREVRFRADGRELSGRRGESLLGALRRAGIEVPSLCYLEGLPAYGACRLCLVEVKRGRKARLATSCDHPVLEGLEVSTDTPAVLRHRRLVLELLLARAPRVEALRALARQHGVEASRFQERAPTGDASEDRCILCGLCVRVCREGVRAEALSLAGRGRHKRLAARPFGELPERCIGCGACAWVCPTDAIQMEADAVARLRLRWGAERPCRHALLGLAVGSVCENDYQCARCEVDQRLIDRAGGRHPVILKLQGGQP